MAGLDDLDEAQIAALRRVGRALEELENALGDEGEAWPDEYQGPVAGLWGAVDYSIQALTHGLKAIDERLLDYAPEPTDQARCAVCGQRTPYAHAHQDRLVGECCWDERLRASE